MKSYDYVSELIELNKAEKVIRKAIDTYSINRKQRDYLFKQLRIIHSRREMIEFKLKINERLRINEKFR